MADFKSKLDVFKRGKITNFINDLKRILKKKFRVSKKLFISNIIRGLHFGETQNQEFL